MQRSLPTRSSLQFHTFNQSSLSNLSNNIVPENNFTGSLGIDVSKSNQDFRPQGIPQFQNFSTYSLGDMSKFNKTSSAENYLQGSTELGGGQISYNATNSGEISINSSMMMMTNNKVDMPQVEQKKRLSIKLTNQERGYYSSLMFQIDPVGNNKVPGKLAATFLKGSGLPVTALKKIWLIAASSNNDYLERDEFYVALKLISYGQNGIDVSVDSILKNIPSPLPVFENVPKPDFKAENMKNKENIYELNPELIAKYEKYFDITDTDKLGEIKGIDAKSTFERSNLPKTSLMKIWTLADSTKKGSLNKAEFIIAIHLIGTAKRGFAIPDVLPESLEEFRREFQEKELGKIATNSKLINRSQSLQPAKVLESKNQGFLSPQAFEKDDRQFMFTNVNENSDEQNRDNTPTEKTKQLKKEQKASRKNSQNSENLSGRSSLSEANQNYEPEKEANLNEPVGTLNYGIQPVKKDSEDNLVLGEIEKVNSQLTGVKEKVNENQKNLSMELSTIREFHTKILTEKSLELNFLMGMVDNYQKISKKLKDEKAYLVEEMKKIEDKKISAKKILLSIQEGIMRDMEENKGLRETLIKKAGDSITEISTIAQNVLELKDTQNKRINMMTEDAPPDRVLRKQSATVASVGNRLQVAEVENHEYNPFNE